MNADRTIGTSSRPSASGALVVALLLAAGTLILYWPVRAFDFVSLDDHVYVWQNAWVQRGLTTEGWRRAWTEPVAANWHPLTMLTHMLDCELFGLDAGKHHQTNVLLHAANAVLVFLVLLAATGKLWPAAIVAALFAWHPLRVESVAWIAERKDLLSGLLGLACLGAYVLYVRDTRWWRYVLVAVLLALGLLAKPMLVTLPCVMLLCDYWPLRRVSPTATASGRRQAWGFLVLEKLPLFSLVAVSSMITFVVQRDQGAVESTDMYPLPGRAANAAVAYVAYLKNTIWPTGLAVPYPLAGTELSASRVAASIVVLIVLTAAAWLARRRCPAGLVGWLWYLGMLVPVIGLVQVGRQAMADRYTYLPTIGLFVAVVYCAATWAKPKFGRLAASGIACCLVVVACVLATRSQLPHWRDSEALYRRALAVTRQNATAHIGLGTELMKQSQYDAAAEHYRLGLEITPADTSALHNLAVIHLTRREKLDEAADLLQRALKAGHRNPAQVHTWLGEVKVLQGDPAGALPHFAAGVQVPGDHRERALVGIGVAQARSGHVDAAIEQYRQILDQRFFPRVADKLAWIYATAEQQEWRDAQAALTLAQEACAQMNNSEPSLVDTLAAALAANGDFETALEAATSALRHARTIADERDLEPYRELASAIAERIELYQAGRPFRQDAREIKF